MQHLYLQASHCSLLGLEGRKTKSRFPIAMLDLCSGCCVGLKLIKTTWGVDLEPHPQHPPGHWISSVRPTAEKGLMDIFPQSVLLASAPPKEAEILSSLTCQSVCTHLMCQGQ